jgi:hypothetical protein
VWSLHWSLALIQNCILFIKSVSVDLPEKIINMFVKYCCQRVNLNQVSFYQLDFQNNEPSIVFYSSQVFKTGEVPAVLTQFFFDTTEEAEACLKMIDERVQVLDLETCVNRSAKVFV